MFKILLLCAVLGYATAAVFGGFNTKQSYGHAASSDDAHAEVKALHSNVHADGFDYALETTNGISVQQSGDANGNVHGEYFYTSPEGVPVKVSYVADENGYQPSGDLLPTPPPIPPQILKALEYIRTHPYHEEEHVRSQPRANTVSQNTYHAKTSTFGRAKKY